MTSHDFAASDDDDFIDEETLPAASLGKRESISRELRNLLYSYGDNKVPYDKTLETFERIVTGYVAMISTRALKVGKPGKLNLEDIYYLIRRDHKKCTRVKQLLTMSEELKKARKAFDEPTEF
ncbi:hypothetical protein QR680_003676 [Steinernema hermaphroditum]|uniref:Transcription initiation factor TFIID subunit 13 n=1 Tax=Steinernema hermaphroditum TaxID=289476 RepID=A0AA39HM62_9BILA|nr:hypothetical protein QR680_003676 [Steinernema hermaphroditum]